MSHFSVLVVTDERPDHDALARILQPWHEFECTGVDDEFIVDIDKTEEAMAEFAKATVVRLKAPDGTLHDRFTDQDALHSRTPIQRGKHALSRLCSRVPRLRQRAQETLQTR